MNGDWFRARFWSQTTTFLTGHLVACHICSLAPLTSLTCFLKLHFVTLASFTVSLTLCKGWSLSICDHAAYMINGYDHNCCRHWKHALRPLTCVHTINAINRSDHNHVVTRNTPLNHLYVFTLSTRWTGMITHDRVVAGNTPCLCKWNVQWIAPHLRDGFWVIEG